MTNFINATLRHCIGIALLPVLMGYQGISLAAGYPTHAISLIVPFTAGSAADILCRLITAEMSKSMGQAIVVYDKPGASGLIGTREVTNATPDGYTIGYANVVTLAINQSLYPKLPYDADKQLTPIALMGKVQSVLVVRKDLPMNNVSDLIAYAKSHPGRLSAGSAGNGSTGHLSIELLKRLAGVDITHVPYKGAAQATQDLIGGRIDILFDNLTSMAPQIDRGAVKALGVTGDRRSPAYPALPTIQEAGVAGFKTEAWAGLVAPAGTPAAIVEQLNAEVNQALQSPALKERLAALSFETTIDRPDALFSRAKDERARWARIIRDAGITAD
ncbi:MFS transporter [Bordetella genomosp. 8]|uniref:MFS transporter n=1 Tax=Bordetella genomosp. 8 TaxID=1416806 RepID=A0A1W6YT12_9BORD|nr:tripartite tricarboxylate transporter substrate binding protein [Bordetella genomosp. 8]ARP84232.1 MFS transporter [Bordetella genomosp. 8]